jgi:hypothetical protein
MALSVEIGAVVKLASRIVMVVILCVGMGVTAVVRWFPAAAQK